MSCSWQTCAGCSGIKKFSPLCSRFAYPAPATSLQSSWGLSSKASLGIKHFRPLSSPVVGGALHGLVTCVVLLVALLFIATG